MVQELLHSNFGFHLSIKYFLHYFCSILYSSIAPVLAIAIKHGLCSWQSLPIWMQQDPWFNVSSIQHWERQRGLQSKLQSKAFLDTKQLLEIQSLQIQQFGGICTWYKKLSRTQQFEVTRDVFQDVSRSKSFAAI